MAKKILTMMLALMMGVGLFAGCAASNTAEDVAGQAAEGVAPAATEDADVVEEVDNTAADAAEDAGSGGALAKIQQDGYFTVGLDDAFPPMGYRDEAGEIVGFDIDLARAVAEKMGVEVRFQPVVWDNIVQEINNKNVDVIWNGCTITDERKAVFDFSQPYMLNRQCVVVLKDSSYQTFADLNGKKAAIQDGSSANIALDANPEFKESLSEIVGYASNDKAFSDLVIGGVDCVIVDSTVYGYYQGLQPDKFRVFEQDLGSEEFGIAFHQDADDFREDLQEALDACINEGIATEISMKWFGVDVTAQ